MPPSSSLRGSSGWLLARIFATLALVAACSGQNKSSYTQGAGGDLAAGGDPSAASGSSGAAGSGGDLAGMAGMAGALAGSGGAMGGSAGMAGTGGLTPTPNGGTSGAPMVTCPPPGSAGADAGAADAGTPTYPTTCEEIGSDPPPTPPICATVKATRDIVNGIPSDESTIDTAEIQRALNVCCVGQAVELTTDGAHTALLSGALTLKSGVSLVIDAGVTLFMSRNPRDFGTTCAGDASGKCSALINVTNGKNQGVYGAGTIEGRGNETILGVTPAITWWDQENALGGNLTAPRMLQVGATPGFVLQGITMHSAPKFHVVIASSNGFIVWGITIHTDPNSPNTDGVDPAGSSNGVIAYNKISTGDDNIAIKGSGPVNNLVIVHNHFGKGHGMSIGSETNAGVQNVKVCDLSLDGTGNGLRIKSDVSRGGEVQNISYSDVCMRNVGNPFVFNPFYDKNATGTLVPYFHDISLKNVHVLGAGTLTFRGYDATKEFTATFDNVIFDDPANVAYKGLNAALAFGPGPVNIAPTGTNVTFTDNVTNSDPPLDCSNAWVPIP